MQFNRLKRREFITLLGGAAAWPLCVRAQQPRARTIGYFGSTTAAAERSRTDAFVQRLAELGWTEGHSVAIEYRSGERARPNASPRSRPLSFSSRLMSLSLRQSQLPSACKQATAIIPIVFPLAGDPLGTGLVASLSRPGGNITGLSKSGGRSRRKAPRNFTAARSRFSTDWRPWPMSNMPVAYWR